MPNDFERRLAKLEDRFDEYMSMFYRWLDELRTDHEQSKHRIEQNEKSIEELKEMNAQSLTIQTTQTDLLSKMMNLILQIDTKIDNLSKPGSNGKH